jgi:tRNA(adenine34) deaminase
MDEQSLRKHEKYMQRCLELADEAKAHGKAPVGSVIVKEGKIIGEGIEGTEKLPAILAHAEVAAVLQAISNTDSNDLSECTLYTTVEPCFMCSYLIRQTKISKVVFGIRTPGVGGVSSGYPFLPAKDIAKWPSVPLIIEGILKRECLAL